MAEGDDVPRRSYGCSYGCGNPYDFVVVQVVDSSTLLLCTPCFIRTAMEAMQAMTEFDNPEVMQRIAAAGDVEIVPMEGRQVARRGHEAPADVIDESAIDMFESFVLSDELPDGFNA